MDVTVEQRLSYRVVRQTLSCVVAFRLTLSPPLRVFAVANHNRRRSFEPYEINDAFLLSEH